MLTLELKWREDFGGAAVLRDGSFAGTLALEPWWPEPSGDPVTAWVAGYFDPDTEKYTKVCVEAPAQDVDAGRTTEMLDKTHKAIADRPPALAGPAAAPAPAKLGAEEVDDQLDRVIAAWVDSLDE